MATEAERLRAAIRGLIRRAEVRDTEPVTVERPGDDFQWKFGAKREVVFAAVYWDLFLEAVGEPADTIKEGSDGDD